jgi:hypothetical protein
MEHISPRDAIVKLYYPSITKHNKVKLCGDDILLLVEYAKEDKCQKSCHTRTREIML